MTAADRPWWATDGDATHDPDEDPLDAHRAARRGEPSEEGEGPEDAPGPGGGRGGASGGPDDGSWWVPATEAVTRLARELATTATERTSTAGGPEPRTDDDRDGHRTGPHDGDGGDGGGGDGGDGDGPVHRIDACGVCPICVGLRAIGDARPDLAVHLAEAARQLSLAVRTVVDAAAPDGEAGADPRGSGRRARRSDDLHRIDLDD